MAACRRGALLEQAALDRAEGHAGPALDGQLAGERDGVEAEEDGDRPGQRHGHVELRGDVRGGEPAGDSDVDKGHVRVLVLVQEPLEVFPCSHSVIFCRFLTCN